jgi:hypothetical protein
MIRPRSQHLGKLALPPDDQQRWRVARSECEGAPLIVRYNVTAGEWAGHPELPIKLGVAIPLNRPDSAGLPDSDENAALNQIEDVVAGEVLSATFGVYALALTTGEMREFVFYIASGADIATVHARIREQVPGHDVQCMAVEDRQWETYRTFVP